MRVRDAADDDAVAIAEIYHPYVEQSAASFEEVAPDAQEIAARMRGSRRLPWLVAEDPARGVVGYAYSSTHRERAAYRWAVDCSVYLRADACGRGIGKLLYSTLLPTLHELGYWRAYAGIALPNPASVGLHETMGFVPVGVYEKVGYKYGRWHDVGWWQLALITHHTAGQVLKEPREYHPRDDD